MDSVEFRLGSLASMTFYVFECKVKEFGRGRIYIFGYASNLKSWLSKIWV